MAALAKNPARLFTTLAQAEMVTWTLLLLGMVAKYVLDLGGLGVRIGGGLHGFVFLSYVLVTVLVAVDQKWRLGDLIAGLGSAIVPYLTVPFERSALRRGLLGDAWRLRDEEGRGIADRVVALVVRRPVPAAIVCLVAIALVFTGLLAVGPPTQWFA